MSCVICGEDNILDNRCERCGWTQPQPASLGWRIFDGALLVFLVGTLLCFALWAWSLFR